MSLRVQVTQPSDPSYRIIPLTQGQVTVVDTEDYEFLSQWKWCALWMPTVRSFYAVRSTPRDPITRKQQRITMARVIMSAPPDKLVDHWNHDTLNNRRFNLRICTYSQNGANQRKIANRSSRFRGVSWNTEMRKWKASVRYQGKLLELGFFNDELAAARRYRDRAIELFGEFASYVDVPESNSTVVA